MHTPSLNALSTWLNHHKFLLTLFAFSCGTAFTYFAKASELHSLKAEFYQFRAVDIVDRELDSVRSQIDLYKSNPSPTQQHMDYLDRLKREEKRLEEKKSRLSS